MKKGIQYSHYCGTQLMELISSISLCIDLIKEDNKEDAIKWCIYAQNMTEQLTKKISDLDNINNMNF